MKTKPQTTTLSQLITAEMTRAGESPELIRSVIANTQAGYPPGLFDRPLTPEDLDYARGVLELTAELKLNQRRQEAVRN